MPPKLRHKVQYPRISWIHCQGTGTDTIPVLKFLKTIITKLGLKHFHGIEFPLLSSVTFMPEQ